MHPPILETPPPSKVHIETWGCQMNVKDSEEMLGLLQRESYVHTSDASEADLILLNTCHIREKAKHKVLSRLGELRSLKLLRPGLRIAVTGCVAQAEGERLLQEAPVIDLVIGPGKIHELVPLLRQHQATGLKQVARGFNKHDDHPKVGAPLFSPSLSPSGEAEISRFINIAQGCNNFCTFCVVPFTRGGEVSKSIPTIIAEARQLLDGGARELTLLGQNVNSYGLDLEQDPSPSGAGPFVELLRAVLALKGLARLRFTTSNPHDFSRPLAELFGQYPALGQYLHLPVQSGSDRILTAMRRKVTRAEYQEKLSWLRAAQPTIALSTDIIVGFPGETEEDFAETLSLVEAAKFSFIFSFKYSSRKGTAAARFRDQVASEVMEERLARLNALQAQISLRLNEAEVGKTREILVNYESRKEPGIFYGRTPHFRLVRIPSGRPIVGQLVHAEIIGAGRNALTGRLAD